MAHPVKHVLKLQNKFSLERLFTWLAPGMITSQLNMFKKMANAKVWMECLVTDYLSWETNNLSSPSHIKYLITSDLQLGTQSPQGANIISLCNLFVNIWPVNILVNMYIHKKKRIMVNSCRILSIEVILRL